MQKVANTAIKKPKTLKEGVDSFLNLFKDTQREYLKEISDYNMFFGEIVPSKNNLSLSDLNTPEELKEVKSIIRKNEKKLNEVNE